MPNNIEKIFKRVILEGHFVGTSGKHMAKYIQKDMITENPEDLLSLSIELASKIKHINVDVVVAPAMGAIILGNYVAYEMGVKKSIFCEKDKDAKYGFVFKRGYDKHLKGARVVVVEDILNTGGSAKDTIQTVRLYGGEVVALLALVNRNRMTAKDFTVPELITLTTGKEGEYSIYEPEKCPLCKKNIPINTDVGHGAKFLEKISIQNAVIVDGCGPVSH